MLFSISGAQGSGKSTVIEQIKTLGYDIIERKTSRSIMAEWNVSLDQVYADNDLMVMFQNELLRRKAADEEEAIASNKIWFTERSYADVFAYTLIVLGKFNKNSEWLNDYYTQCQKQNSKYAAVFYISPFTKENAEDDGVRGINKHYSELVDLTIKTTLGKMAYDPKTATHHFEIKSVDSHYIDERVRTILQYSHDHWLQESVKRADKQVHLTLPPSKVVFEVDVEEFMKS